MLLWLLFLWLLFTPLFQRNLCGACHRSCSHVSHADCVVAAVPKKYKLVAIVILTVNEHTQAKDTPIIKYDCLFTLLLLFG